MNEDNNPDEQVEIKEMLEIKCRYILEFEDLDVICGKPQISGKDAALQMEERI